MRLSLRLQAAADLVDVRTVIADVGTDHAYLPIWLCENGRIRSAIAMDLREGPLQRAGEHIREAGLAARIETRLSDGLSALTPGEADSAVITGMGGILISRILRQSQEVTSSLAELILGPQSDEDLVRRTLEETGFHIDRERMLREEGKYYTLIHAIPDPDAPARQMSREEALFGPRLLENRDPVLHCYLQDQIRVKTDILARLRDRDGESARKRYREIEEEERLLEAAMQRYEL